MKATIGNRVRRLGFGVMLGCGAVAVLGVAQASSVAQGKAIFDAQCAACHSVKPGVNGIGPSLYGVYGKPAAHVAGFAFSAALTNSHLVWNKVTLSKFLADPQALVPGTKMPYLGLPSAKKRAEVIAYLKNPEAK